MLSCQNVGSRDADRQVEIQRSRHRCSAVDPNQDEVIPWYRRYHISQYGGFEVSVSVSALDASRIGLTVMRAC